ncbi:DinB family protein [Deinococcus altitudinis]|uniref:DinB family protein n=1 Tax=Deinococcus altitudinis TaxID=468914 RepID=UPI00389123F6
MSAHRGAAQLPLDVQRAASGAGDFFGALGPDVFFSGTDGHWSPAHHLVHLTLSNRPLTQALRLPRLALSALGGRTEAGRVSRTSEEIREFYLAALKAGGRASGRYLPTLSGGTGAASQQMVVTAFRTSAAELSAAISGWSEADLDGLLLPHPVLGKLTVREMLYFAVYHHSHHLEGVRRRLQSEPT